MKIAWSARGAISAITMLLALTGEQAMAQENPAERANTGPELVLGVTEQGPQIDGILSDEVWKNATRVNFVDSTSAQVPKEPTEAWVAYDKQHLYFAFKCHESQMDKLVAKRTQINDLLISLDDCVEIFLAPPIDPPPPAGSYFQFIINADGIYYASSPYTGTNWSSGIRVGAKRWPDSWTLEIAVEFQSLTRDTPITGEVWTGNLNREQKTHGMNLLSAYSPVGGDFHALELFGAFRFEKQPRPTGPYSFSGNVVTDQGPLKDARAVIGQQIALTDSKGNFTVQNIPKGPNTLSITKSGFRPMYKPVVRRLDIQGNQVEQTPFSVETMVVNAYGFDWPLKSATAGKRYQIYFNHVGSPIGPGIRPSEDLSADEYGMTLKTVATLGSYEPVTFTVFTAEELTHCTVSVGDLICRDDSTYKIKSESADVRAVKVWIPPVELGGSGGYRPEILQSLTTVNMGAKTFRQFWITWHVPRDARAGVYAGQIIFQPQNAAETVLQVEITVFPFELHKSKDKRFGLFYLGGGGRSGLFNMDKKENHYRADFIDMREHGVGGFVFPAEPTFKRASGGAIDIDFASVDRVLDVLTEIEWKDVHLVMNFGHPMHRDLASVTGMDSDATSAGQFSEEHVKTLKEAVAGINARVRQRGFPSPYYMWYDEITAIDAVEVWVNMAKVFKPISDGGKSFITLHHTAPRKSLDLIAPYLDAAVSGATDHLDSILEVKEAYPAISEWHIYGAIGGSFAENRKNNGYRFYRAPVSFTWGWAYQAIVKNQEEGRKRSYPWITATVPAEDGTPIPTLQWEGYREGVKDFRYLVTLEHAIAGWTSLSRDSDAVQDAKTLLNSVKEEARPKDNGDLDVLRKEIGDAITRLLSQ